LELIGLIKARPPLNKKRNLNRKLWLNPPKELNTLLLTRGGLNLAWKKPPGLKVRI